MIDVFKLKKGETGERLNIKETYKWILEEMSYEEFYDFAKLRFWDSNGGYTFRYNYMVNKKGDSPKAREDYIKYLCYKLIQNLDTDGVSLEK